MKFQPTADDIALTFAARQTKDSQFSHWTISTEELIQRIIDNFSNMEKGYRNGVILIPVNPEGFYSGVRKLNENDVLQGVFSARQEGEEPRKQVYAIGEKTIAQSVKVILYNKEVLAENNENRSDAEWEIISVNASPTMDDVPIPVDALIYNHFGLSGGTATNMTDEEFCAALKKSVAFWADKAMVLPKNLVE